MSQKKFVTDFSTPERGCGESTKMFAESAQKAR
jgi:hypothetical protein